MSLSTTLKGAARRVSPGGSINAALRDAQSLVFNIRSSVIHWFNYRRMMRQEGIRKIHFGCGADYKKGFLNVDFNPPADTYLDARNKFPFPDGSIDEIYSSHFVEHLSNAEIDRHFREAFRVLAAGGHYRICIPDFEKIVRAYLEKDTQFLSRLTENVTLKGNPLPPHLWTYGDYIDKALHENGKHRVFLDAARLGSLLENAGFLSTNVTAVDFDSSLDSAARRPYSAYFIARKH